MDPEIIDESVEFGHMRMRQPQPDTSLSTKILGAALAKGLRPKGAFGYTKIRYSTLFVCVSRSACDIDRHLYLDSELKKVQPYDPFKFDVFTVRNIFFKYFTRYLCLPSHCSSVRLSITRNTLY